MKIENTVAVITGGANGIGETVAKHLANKGAKIVLADLDEKNLIRVKEEIEKSGGKAEYLLFNVTKEEDSEKLMKFAVEKFGSLNILVPCAGIIRDNMLISIDRETRKVSKKLSLNDWNAVINVNLTGTFLCVRDAAEMMINNNFSGIIFTISSINKEGQIGQLNYSSTKVATALMPKILIGEFNRRKIRHIRVVGIAPGYVATPMVKGMDQKYLNEVIVPSIQLGRLIEPEEVADLIAYVCTNDAINATTIEITGGLTHKDGTAK